MDVIIWLSVFLVLSSACPAGLVRACCGFKGVKTEGCLRRVRDAFGIAACWVSDAMSWIPLCLTRDAARREFKGDI